MQPRWSHCATGLENFGLSEITLGGLKGDIVVAVLVVDGDPEGEWAAVAHASDVFK